MTNPHFQTESILFFGDGGITKGMLHSDYEVILDGVIGVMEFANQTMHAAYVETNGQRQVVAVVLFTVEFDDSGNADRSWNIPLRHMLEMADLGPDIGAGPIRFVCKSQCPVNFQQDKLWDPILAQGANEFAIIRDYISENAESMGLDTFADPADVGFAPEPVPVPVEQAVPAASAQIPELVPELAVEAPVLETAVPLVTAEAENFAEMEAELLQYKEDRVRLARMVKEQQLQIQTLETARDEDMAVSAYEFEQKEAILNAQVAKLLTQYDSTTDQNEALKEQITSLKAQIESLRETLDVEVALAASKGKEELDGELSRLTNQYQVALDQKLAEESANMREQMRGLEMESADKDEIIKGLREEIEVSNSLQLDSAKQGAEEYLQKLEELGLNFIVFHPGAGNISIAFKDINKYISNPEGYAAEKCLVTESRYRAWLAHNNDPVCIFAKGDDDICGARVTKVESPRQFKEGESEYCLKCQGSGDSIETLMSSRR